MEAIGIAASFIAIGQALLAGRHVANVLREIPRIGNELASLSNEIESLRASVEAAKMQGMTSFGNELESYDLQVARCQINDIANGLESIRLKCTQVGKHGKIKARKTKWFLMQKELQQCREKARDARAALQLALIALNLKGTARLSQLALHVENLALRPARDHSLASTEAINNATLQVDNNLSRPPASESLSNQGQDRAISEQDVETRMIQLSLPPVKERLLKNTISTGMDMIVFKARLMSASRCTQNCKCRCHGSQPSSVICPSWIRNLVGSLSATYDRRIFLGNINKCTEFNCKGNTRATATFEYQLPAWLCARHVSIQVYMDSCRGLRSSLRSVRVRSSNDLTMLAIQTHDCEAVKGCLAAFGPAFPDDRDAWGHDMMLHVIGWATAETLQFMTQYWVEHLRKDSYNPTWFFAANRALERGRYISTQRAEALRLIVSYGEDIIDAPQTELHEAVHLADPAKVENNIRSAVTECPWKADQLNCQGYTPLLLAAKKGNFHVVRELVRLGCNIDQKDYDRRTALMLASLNGHIHIVHYLLDAGCPVNAASNFGYTALHFAAKSANELDEDPGAILKALILAGASAQSLSIEGETALHDMGSFGPGMVTRRAAKAKIRLLLGAGVNINATDNGNYRPLERAFFFNFPEAIKCLIEAGAEVTHLRGKQNLLHLAARMARVETLEYLASMSLPALNVNQRDDWGDTPWDSFTWVLHARHWELGSWRRPTSREKDAFVALYKKLRDRNLGLDISRLQRIRQHLEDEILHGAMTVSQSLINEKRDWEQWESLRTYETIRLQIREQMIDAALESVDENIEVLKEKVEASPWDHVSHRDPSETEESDDLEDYTESEWTETEDDAGGELNEAENNIEEPASHDD